MAAVRVVASRVRLGLRVTAAAVLVLWGAALAGPGPAALASPPAPHAPASVASKPTADFSLTVSPTRLVIPQEQLSKDQHFAVTNHGRLPLDVVVNRAGFTSGRDGTLRFQRTEAPYSALTWISASPAKFHLEPGARQVVAVRIAVPRDPEPGDHHVAILFMVPAVGDQKQIKLNRGIGVPLYITVPGPVDDTVKIPSLRTSGFAMGGPVHFTATFQDTGTVHRDFREKGHLNLQVDGRDVAFPDFTVQRGTTREVTARWDDPPLMCICRAKVSVPGPHGTLQSAKATVVVFPVWPAVAVLAGILAISLIGVLVRRRYRTQVLKAARSLRHEDDLTGLSRSGSTVPHDNAGVDLFGDFPESDPGPEGDTPNR
ncbi:fimbrial biogenesis chaperone [Frankia sp. AgKG'84/4]|uniref:hypothetical protein n=1 Tax=Frankia sp. AgKG'84/4 TaxID=573490 RepID=UPI00200F5F0F|nr:hypothetical protein [Frankia sp. AgKG'84/4]MCL9794319.1 hypothetical protein [Frankia sp. AgKG'84/4]